MPQYLFHSTNSANVAPILADGFVALAVVDHLVWCSTTRVTEAMQVLRSATGCVRITVPDGTNLHQYEIERLRLGLRPNGDWRVRLIAQGATPISPNTRFYAIPTTVLNAWTREEFVF